MKLITILLLVSIIFISGCVNQQCSAEDCQLSLCDCKCHPAGETPEEKTGALCGINCLGEYGVSGCECVNGECIEVKQ